MIGELGAIGGPATKFAFKNDWRRRYRGKLKLRKPEALIASADAK